MLEPRGGYGIGDIPIEEERRDECREPSDSRSERSHTTAASASGIATKMAPGITRPVSTTSIPAPTAVAMKPATAKTLMDAPPINRGLGASQGVMNKL